MSCLFCLRYSFQVVALGVPKFCGTSSMGYQGAGSGQRPIPFVLLPLGYLALKIFVGDACNRCGVVKSACFIPQSKRADKTNLPLWCGAVLHEPQEMLCNRSFFECFTQVDGLQIGSLQKRTTASNSIMHSSACLLSKLHA